MAGLVCGSGRADGLMEGIVMILKPWKTLEHMFK